MLYRQPAYLLCTDCNLDINQLLQAYIWRWEIEVNFRDEKTLLGCGQAQVRKEIAVRKIPTFVVAIYSLMLLADHKARNNNNQIQLPRAYWYKPKMGQRHTAGDILNNLRSQLWASNVQINFSHFVNLQNTSRSRKNTVNPTLSAAFYRRN